LTEVVYKRGLTARVVIISVALAIIAAFVNNWTLNFGGLWTGPIPLSIVYVLIINEALGRVNPRWRLSRQELAVLFVALFAIGGYGYSMYAETKFGINIINSYDSILRAIQAMSVSPTRTYFMNKIPPHMVPSLSYVDMAWNGLARGQSIEWAVWAIPITFWTSWFLAFSVWSYLLAFIMRKQMIETEKLPFAMVGPSAYPIVWATEPKESASNLWNFKSASTRIFFIGLVLGFFSAAPDIVNYFIKVLPSSSELTFITLDLNPIVRTVLPGAILSGVLILPRISVFCLCTMDFLLSGAVAYLVMYTLYPPIGIWTGVLPAGPYDYMSAVGPLRPYYGSQTGMVVGLGLWFLYIARSQIKQFFSSLYNALRRQGDVTVEQGVPYHYISAGFLGLTAVIIVLVAVSGVPFSIVLLVLLTYFILHVGNIYSAGQYPPMAESTLSTVPVAFNAGVATGLWGTSIPNPSVEAANTMAVVGTMQGRLWCTYNGQLQCMSFKVADLTETRAKDILIMMVLMSVVGAITIPLGLWWAHLYGLKNLFRQYHGLSTTYTAAASPYTADVVSTQMIGWALVTVLLFAIRMRFPASYVNPIGVFTALWGGWYGFPNMLFALIFKWLALKIGGSKLWYDKVVPGLIGFSCGYGMVYGVVQLTNFFLRALPAAF